MSLSLYSTYSFFFTKKAHSPIYLFCADIHKEIFETYKIVLYQILTDQLAFKLYLYTVNEVGTVCIEKTYILFQKLELVLLIYNKLVIFLILSFFFFFLVKVLNFFEG